MEIYIINNKELIILKILLNLKKILRKKLSRKFSSLNKGDRNFLLPLKIYLFISSVLIAFFIQVQMIKQILKC